MRWVSLGSIGLIAFMGCTGPVAAQQAQSRPKPKRGATRAVLLASTALATGIFAGAMVNPQTAQAACGFTRTITTTINEIPIGTITTIGSNTQMYLFSNGPMSSSFSLNDFRVSSSTLDFSPVTCDTTTTTNDSTTLFVTPGTPVSGVILPGATVGGFGLSFGATAGRPLSVSNAGTV